MFSAFTCPVKLIINKAIIIFTGKTLIYDPEVLLFIGRDMPRPSNGKKISLGVAEKMNSSK
jgi:hypothetical protein